MRLFGLIGYPLSHSFSKKYFTEKFEKEGLTDCRFENFPISTVDDVLALMKENTHLEGLAVTIPFKQSILKHLDDTAGIPAGLSACNCIKINSGRMTGYNTDYAAFEQSLLPLLKSYHQKALVLGNGGATAAVIFVLKKLGINYTVVSRKIHNGSALTYIELDEKIVKENALIINTTPLGMYPDVEACPDIPYHFITDRHLLYDLVYNPAETLFLQKGRERGAAVKNGEEMLVRQAEVNWKIWNG